MSNNNISGEIPSEIMDSTQLCVLDLSSNDIVGEIPMKLKRMVSLFNLKLNNNHLSGNIPPEFGKLSNLQILDLAANDLSGSIPGALGECIKLFNLNLSNNRLGESIPAEIGRIHNLQILDLGYDLLIGKIPQQIGELQRLETLNLSHNELSGLIPSSFDNMLNLTSVDVSFNQLDGAIPKLKAFREAPFDALRGNKGLCGNATGLKTCPAKMNNGAAKKNSTKLVIVLLVFCKKYRKKKNDPRRLNNENLFAIWSYDGKMVYESIIEATENFGTKHCVGEGGCGTVYQADLASGQLVAVKKLQVSPDGDLANLKGISDFGTTRFMKPDSSNWTSFAGTFGYATPELAYTMEVNERCDVYSFGVLTMEVIMGKHPGDLIFFLSSSSSSSSSTSTAHGILLKDVLDQRLPTPENQVAEQVVVVAKLAFACLHANPPSRPTMRQVAMKLSDDLRSHLQNEFHMITLGQLISTAQPLEYLPSILGLRRFSSSGWVLSFRRNPYSCESVDLSTLVHVLNSVPELRPGVEDKLVWNFGTSRVYSVKSAYEWLSSINSSGLVVPRVLVFWTPVVPLCSVFVIPVLKMSVMSFFIARNEIKFAGSDVNWLVSWLRLSISLFAAALCCYIVVCLLLLSIVVAAALCCLAAVAAVLIYCCVFAVLPCFGLSAGWFLTN
ncbi:hypothetical protein ACSBR1_004214 [Camellia fascicularis]